MNDLNLKFKYKTKIVCKINNLCLHKAINQKGKFLWIDKSGFPKDAKKEFYLTIISDLNLSKFSSNLTAYSFNFFDNLQDFYSKYTFVKSVKR